jgi:RNA polymerase sigma-70 factor (ECF subfamily)
MDEQAQIDKCREGDLSAFEPLFHKHVRKAVGVAYMITRDWALAEDATQEAFSRAFRTIRSFRRGQPFAPWLFRIVVNEARRVARRRGGVQVAPLSEDVFDPDSPETLLLKKEHADEIWKAIHSLDEERRVVIVLKYLSGFSEKEIAEALRLRQSTVKSRLYVARQRLIALLSRSGEGL